MQRFAVPVPLGFFVSYLSDFQVLSEPEQAKILNTGQKHPASSLVISALVSTRCVRNRQFVRRAHEHDAVGVPGVLSISTESFVEETRCVLSAQHLHRCRSWINVELAIEEFQIGSLRGRRPAMTSIIF